MTVIALVNISAARIYKATSNEAQRSQLLSLLRERETERTKSLPASVKIYMTSRMRLTHSDYVRSRESRDLLSADLPPSRPRKVAEEWKKEEDRTRRETRG